uniref:peroxisomal multifunctional enzyme type 2 n=1 Tax=Myxine glutinosa TaxID=7769 RepID=UPI00358F2DB2
MASLSFNGKVALVTGAGGGIGREYALAFAARGARVVVNDLGGNLKGQGKSSQAADKVVEEIVSKGGQAVANYDSVEEGDKLVKTALDAFGRIDVLVNNAGILRDRSFPRISDTDWDIVHRIHLRGSFMVTRAAWNHMKKQKYGRIIMTTSVAGLHGNFGQANYSSAKLGLVGLSNTLAIEGKKYNISCNVIAPTAGSRLTLTVLPPELLDVLKAEYVSPLVIWLCHETCSETGGVFEVAAGWIAKMRWQQAQGSVLKRRDQPMTAEDVRDNWKKICDFSDCTFPSSTQDSMTNIMSVISRVNGQEGVSPSSTDTVANSTEIEMKPSQASQGFKLPQTVYSYGHIQPILYALGVGASVSVPGDLRYLYEGNPDFSCMPTFSVIPAQACIMGGNLADIPGLNFNIAQVLHGEQYLEVIKLPPTSGKLISEASVADVTDKGSWTVILINVHTHDEDKVPVSFNQFTLLVPSSGGFAGSRSSGKMKKTHIKPPNRVPDASTTEKTTVDQAALYRLSGDFNPLHIDSEISSLAGFPKPILHGLCLFGFVARHVLQRYANGDGSKLKAIKVRFSKPVIPGQTLTTDMWKEGHRVIFQMKVENGGVVLSGGYIDLVPDKKPIAVPLTEKAPALRSKDVLEELQQRVRDNGADLVRKVCAVFQFDISGSGHAVEQWTIDLKSGKGEIYRGVPKKGKADAIISLSEENFVGLVTRKIEPQKAFFSGKMKVKGNLLLLQRIESLLVDNAKL